MKMTLSLLFWRISAFGWMATMFVLSSQQTLPAQDGFLGQDKLEHCLAYGLLAILLSCSIKPMRVETWQRVILLAGLTTLYGISDEFHQAFVPGRDASAWDILADGIGGMMAGMFLFWLERNQAKPSFGQG